MGYSLLSSAAEIQNRKGNQDKNDERSTKYSQYGDDDPVVWA